MPAYRFAYLLVRLPSCLFACMHAYLRAWQASAAMGLRLDTLVVIGGTRARLSLTSFGCCKLQMPMIAFAGEIRRCDYAEIGCD